MAAGCKRDPVWEYFNEVPLSVGKTGMHPKCKQCNKEMQDLVAQMKQHHEKCFFSGGSWVEDDERNMSEHAGSLGESILNIQDSEDYPPSRSPSFSIVSELSANDSVSVTSCMSHSHSISLLMALASSVGVERIFSSSGLIHSKLRNRLGQNMNWNDVADWCHHTANTFLSILRPQSLHQFKKYPKS